MKILFFGDIIGKSGRQAVTKILPQLREQHQPDLVMANAENLAHGKGITLKTIAEMLEAGIDFFTSGNHVFDKPEARAVFEEHGDKIIRPANWEGNFPGAGFKLLEAPSGAKVLVLNLMGQVFMEKQVDEGKISNPFLKLNEILEAEGNKAKIKIVDFHAEATSEKRGMGLWADGRVSAVLGTHTHIPTADGQVLAQGSGYLTDLGMVGAYPSVIGVDTEAALKRFLTGEEATGKKIPLEVADTGAYEIGFAVLEIDEDTGKCQNIKGYWNQEL